MQVYRVLYNMNHIYFICFVFRQVKEVSAEINKAKTNGKTCKRWGKIIGSKVLQVLWVYFHIWLLCIGFSFQKNHIKILNNTRNCKKPIHTKISMHIQIRNFIFVIYCNQYFTFVKKIWINTMTNAKYDSLMI